MATLGVDCNITMSGVGYWLKEGSWNREKPRLIRNRLTKNGTYHYVDKGPLFNTFSFTIVLWSGIANSNATSTTTATNAARIAIWTLYNSPNTTFVLVTPYNESYTVIFKDLKERILNGLPLKPTNFDVDYELDCQLEQVS